MQTKIYNQKGKEKSSVKLAENIFGVSWNGDLVHQVITSMQSNARTPVAHSKDRSEVAGGGKKPWQQKGTGRARHGSIRSPIWVGGGVAHGPRKERNYTKKINKKMRVKALVTVLSQKYRDGEILFIDSLSVDDARTKNAQGIVDALTTIKGFSELSGRNTLLVLPEMNEDTIRAFHNIPNISIASAAHLNPVTVLNHRYVILVTLEDITGIIKKRFSY